MLLVLDVGNSNTVIGLYEGERLVSHWRLTTARERTIDEYGILIHQLFTWHRLDPAVVDGVIIASVVPPLNFTLKEMIRLYFKRTPLFVEPGIKTGMPILYDNPLEVGADRIVNAVAAQHLYGNPCVVVDLGTATTFDVVSERGEYAGGIIAPGVKISSEALFERTARLPRVDIGKPARLIGKNTTASIQSGIYYGYIGLLDGILERLKDEMPGLERIVATGGLAELLASGSRHIQDVNQVLTLLGLRLVWERNQGG